MVYAGRDENQGDRAAPLQQPGEHSVVATYAAGIAEKGIVPGVRGEGWFVWSKNRALPALAVSFGTLSDAAYLAFEKYPDSRYVKAIQDSAQGGAVEAGCSGICYIMCCFIT